MEDFDKFAHEYKKVLDKSVEMTGETGDYFSTYKADFVGRLMGNDFSGKILDYGCGIGLLSEILLKKFPLANINGADVSAASIEHVPASLKQQGLFTSDMNLLARDYDLIVIANVLHHIEPLERAGVVAGLQKLLKNQGMIIVFEHNPFNPITCNVVKNCPLDTGVVLLPFNETLSHLKNGGFKDLQHNYIVFFPKVLSFLRWAEPHLSWLPLGAQYAAIGRVDKNA